jgi:hypothetical protein
MFNRRGCGCWGVGVPGWQVGVGLAGWPAGWGWVGVGGQILLTGCILGFGGHRGVRVLNGVGPWVMVR